MLSRVFMLLSYSISPPEYPDLSNLFMQKTLLCICFIASLVLPCYAAAMARESTEYTPTDSIAICTMLAEAKKQPAETNWMMFFASRFLDKPYRAHTLDQNSVEKLVVNTREVDCTTFIEQICALSHCMLRNETDFSAFCKHLRNIRYADGVIDYCKRNHYFTLWIKNNCNNGYITPVMLPSGKGFRAHKTLNINYMSTHTESYAMLRNNSQRIARIKEMEGSFSGSVVTYIPKHSLHNHSLLKEYISDGDIIVIMTSIKGLDTSHIGMACWRDGKLYMLHASSRHKRVLIEPEPLHTYMMKQPKQTGIMVVRRVNG